MMTQIGGDVESVLHGTHLADFHTRRFQPYPFQILGGIFLSTPLTDDTPPSRSVLLNTPCISYGHIHGQEIIYAIEVGHNIKRANLALPVLIMLWDLTFEGTISIIPRRLSSNIDGASKGLSLTKEPSILPLFLASSRNETTSASSDGFCGPAVDLNRGVEFASLS